jgi:L-aminopeptidase/D-esterase-like protein
VVDPDTGRIVAGCRLPAPLPAPLAALADDPSARPFPGAGRLLRLLRGGAPPPANTTIAAVATNARLDKAGCRRLAMMAQTGLARSIVPVHTPGDGDTVFALATGERANEAPADLLLLGTVAADVLAAAVLRSVRLATPLAGLPSASEIAMRDA